MLLDQKLPVYPPQQYGPPPGHMAQGGYGPLQDPAAAAAGFHGMPMGQRPGYPIQLRMQRPSLRPPGVVPNQPNQLRLQLQHRLQAQQVGTNVHTHTHRIHTLTQVHAHTIFNYSTQAQPIGTNACTHTHLHTHSHAHTIYSYSTQAQQI